MPPLLSESRRESLGAAGYLLLEPPRDAGPAWLDEDPLGAMATDRHGNPCRVVVLPLADHTERLRLWEHLERWRVVDDPGVQPLHDVLDLSDALALVALDDADRTLSALVAAGGTLSPGQGSTLLVVLGRTLARLHALGLAYGEMAPERILVRQGQPSFAFPLPPSSGGRFLTPSTGEDAQQLALLAAGVIAPAHGRDTAGQEVAACEPLVLSGSPGGARPGVAPQHRRLPRTGSLDRPGRDRRRLWTVTGFVTGLVVVLTMLGVAVVHLVPGGGPPRALPGSSPATDVPGGPETQATSPPPVDDLAADADAIRGDDPVAAAGALTRARLDLVQQLTATPPTADAAAWEGIVVAGSPAHVQALGAVDALVVSGSSISGITVTVTSAVGISDDGETASVEVVYQLSEYALHAPTARRTVPASEPVTATLELRRTDEGWRVVEVSESTAATT